MAFDASYGAVNGVKSLAQQALEAGARKGHKVTLVGRKPHIDKIIENGLHISGIWGDYTIRDLNAVTEPPHEHQNIVFLTVKSFDRWQYSEQSCLSLENVMVTVIASETLVGELDGSLTRRVKDIANMLDNAGIPSKSSDNIMFEIWNKALYNIALNPLSGDIMESETSSHKRPQIIHASGYSAR